LGLSAYAANRIHYQQCRFPQTRTLGVCTNNTCGDSDAICQKRLPPSCWRYTL